MAVSPNYRIALPIAGLMLLGVVGTALLELTGLELSLPAGCYFEGGGNDGWIYARAVPWGRLYTYGEIPGIVMAIGAALLWLGGRIGRLDRRLMRPSLVVVLTVVLGPGLLVNGFLKPYWGRPRPLETVQFGGAGAYRPVYRPGGPGAGKSFPCGHCSIAFAIASGGAFYHLHPAAAAGMIAGGVTYGLLMGVARIAQGGHFPTDVLWAGVLMGVLILVLYHVVVRIPRGRDDPADHSEDPSRAP